MLGLISQSGTAILQPGNLRFRIKARSFNSY
jgi:hypothetical protein